MNLKLPGLLAAGLVAAAVPAAIAIAQAPSPGAERPRVSADVRARLLDGRMAMAKTALKLSNDQLALWAPVEKHLRTAAAEREQRWQERRQLREKQQQSGEARQRPSLADRLDRAAERTARRAERMKALAEVFKPFYASLSDEQKAVAGVVLRQAYGAGFRGRGERWAMRRGPADGPGASQVPQVAPKQ
jgi:LTXXQ motif family protein